MICSQEGRGEVRIVEVINGLQQRGGAEVFAVGLSRNLAKIESNEVYLISLFDDVHPSFLKDLKDTKIKVFTCHKRKGVDFKATAVFKKIIKAIDPDIIHMHLSCLSLYFLAFGIRKRSWKLFQTFHSLPGSTSTGFNEFIRKIFIGRKAITFVGISEKITKLAMDKYKGIECETIENGIELKSPNRDGADKIYDLVMVASFTPPKNHKLLLDVMSIVNGNSAVSLVCVGDGPLKNDFLASVPEYLKGRVNVVGRTNDAYKYLLASKVFILSSIREGNPISILEAMDCGLPIIAPKIGGIPDVVKDKINGFLYESGNKEELAESILFFKNNPELIDEIGKRNSEYVKKFSMDICAARYYHLFKTK